MLETDVDSFILRFVQVRDATTPNAPVRDATTPNAPVRDATTPNAPVRDATIPNAPVRDATTPNAPVPDAQETRQDNEPAAAPWHGIIRHVQSKEEIRFTQIEDALRFMANYVQLAAGEPVQDDSD